MPQGKFLGGGQSLLPVLKLEMAAPSDLVSVAKIKDKNKQEYTGSRDDLISQGYTPCSICNRSNSPEDR